jgi:hypothetical protein
MTINFKEIEKANSGTGYQDTFELFARDFLENRGFEIIGDPARGADGGIDLKIKEVRKGVSGQETTFFWLVSCKHFAHSGKSVSPDKEVNILERVYQHKCDGFIGFYSTLASSGLGNLLEGLSDKIPYIIYDREKIEREIVGFGSWSNIFHRYFPESYKNWKNNEFLKHPIKLFEHYFESKIKKHEFGYDILKTIFNSSEFIFKGLLNSGNFDSFFNNQINYIVGDIEEIVNTIHKDNLVEYNKIKAKSYTDACDYIEKIKFIEYVEKTYNLNNNGKQKIRGTSFLENGVAKHYIFKNLLFVNNTADKELNKLYDSLINIIEKN